MYVIGQLQDNIAYIYFATFKGHFNSQTFKEIISTYSCSNGIIIDIRYNIGGSLQSLMEFAACFYTGQRTVLYERHKIGHGHNDFSGYFPVKLSGTGIIGEHVPVVTLTGNRSYSAANYFATIMKTLPNVTLIGARTGGGGSARYDITMPNEWIMSCAQAPTFDIYYNSIEPGIEPHYMPITIDDLEEMQQTGIDKLIEYTCQYLLSK
jgi:C-terminal processing protease CtpA/Prc